MKQSITLLVVLFTSTAFAQNVGIGEPFPNNGKLTVKAADSAVLLLNNSTSTGSDVKTGMFYKTGNYYSGGIATIGSLATFRLGLFTYGSSFASGLQERLSILDGGNVGIGTINPTAKLEVNGSFKLSGVSPGAGKYLISDASGNATWYDASANFLPTGASGNTLRHNGTSFIATSNLYNDGTKIGIGTTTPGSMLEIKSAPGTQADIELNATAGNNALLKLNKNGASNYSTIRFKSSDVVTWDLGTQGDDNFKLKYTPSNITILDVDDVTKNIGIGTNDYSEKINVSGNVSAYGAFISKFSNAGFQFQDRTANAYGGWNWYADGGKANLFRYSTGNVLTIDQVGNTGIVNANPTAPLSFNNGIGNKIDFYYGSASSRYGIGLQGSLLQMYAGSSSDAIAFGYGSSASFTELGRISNVTGFQSTGANAGFWFKDRTQTNYSGWNWYANGGQANLYSYDYGNVLSFNKTTGNAAFSTVPNTSRVSIDAGSGTALEVSGAIKVSGSYPSAFVVVADASNMADGYNPPTNYVPSPIYFKSVIIDNALCNGDPNAILMITPQLYSPMPFSVYYDNSISKWKIKLDTDGVNVSSCYGLANPQGGACGAYYVGVMAYGPKALSVGSKFNVLVIKQ